MKKKKVENSEGKGTEKEMLDERREIMVITSDELYQK